MGKRFLEYDPMTGITTSVIQDEPGKTVVCREQDASLIIEANKVLQNEPEVWRRGVKNSWAHYAQIPNIIIEKWKSEHGVDLFNKDHQKAVFKLLNDPQYKYLKTTTKYHAG